MSTESLLRGISDKDTRMFVRGLVRNGWTVRLTGGGHLRLRHPSGHATTAALTTSDWRSQRNLRRQVRHIERLAQEETQCPPNPNP